MPGRSSSRSRSRPSSASGSRRLRTPRDRLPTPRFPLARTLVTMPIMSSTPLTTLPTGADVVAPRKAWLDQPDDDLLAWLAERGQPRMRLRQIQRWIVVGRAESFEQMSDLPKNLREELAREF